MNPLQKKKPRLVVIYLVSLAFFNSCGKSDKIGEKTKVSCDVSASSYLVAGQDIDYQNSAVSCIDFDSGTSKIILESSSPDAILKRTSDKQYFFFERTAKLNGATTFEISLSENTAKIIKSLDGQKLSGIDAQDPHDIVQYAEDKFLLAGFSSHSLALLNQDKTNSLSLASSNWQLDTDISKFRPTQILKIGERLFILHQSYIEEEYLKPAGKSKIFVFDILGSDSTIKPLNLNKSKKGTQGIELNGTFPNKIWHLEQEQLIGVYSLCASFVDNRDLCKDTIEFYSTNTFQIQTDLKIEIPKKYSMNGGEVGISSDHIYVNVIETQANRTRSVILAINLKNKSLRPIFAYPENTTSSHGIFYNRSQEKLVFGIGEVKSKQGILCELSTDKNSTQTLSDATCSSTMSYIPGQIYPL